jgi:hypothetical protein
LPQPEQEFAFERVSGNTLAERLRQELQSAKDEGKELAEEIKLLKGKVAELEAAKTKATHSPNKLPEEGEK